MKSIGALMLVIGLLVFGTWSMKKLGFGNKAAKSATGEVGLEVLSSMPMGGGKMLAMVQFGGADHNAVAVDILTNTSDPILQLRGHQAHATAKDIVRCEAEELLWQFITVLR